MEKLAWHAANIINSIPHMGKGRKKAVTVDQLLGRNKSYEFTDKESFKAHMRQQERELEAG